MTDEDKENLHDLLDISNDELNKPSHNNSTSEIAQQLKSISFDDEQYGDITKRAKKKLSNDLPHEFDAEDEIARGLLLSLKNLAVNEQRSKQSYRKPVTKWLLWYFSIISAIVAYMLVFSWKYSPQVILGVIGGFFTNLIALLFILLKYLYSPSKELHTFIMAIFNRKHDNITNGEKTRH